jgi:quinol monooxygenase YgiN
MSNPANITKPAPSGTNAAPANPAAKKATKIILAKIRAKAGSEEAFLAESKKVVAGSRAEAGNVSYTLYRGTESQQEFIMVEQWKDQAAIDAHNASAHFQAFVNALGKLGDGKPEIVVYDIAVGKTA